MNRFLSFFIGFISLSTNCNSQSITPDLFQQPTNTGANMTIGINSSTFNTYEGGLVGAFYDLNEDGHMQCVGIEDISLGFFGLPLWGDDTFTPETDGLPTGAIPNFAILFDGNVIAFNTSPEFSGYQTNGVFFVTDAEMLNDTASFCNQDEWPYPFEGNTGSNMNLLLQESFINSLAIETNNAYIVATTETGLVVGSSAVNNPQLQIAIWGNDSFTSEIDGASDGQLISLHLVDSNKLFNLNLSFNYITNNIDVITNEITPELTCTAENLGCKDENACNYNPAATIENGSCNYAETYYDCNGNCINDSDGDGVCDELEILGCTDEFAINYSTIATENDGSCIYVVNGCTNTNACNWNSEANMDDGSCLYPEMYYNCDGNCINDIDLDGECDEEDFNDGIGLNEVEKGNPQLIKIIDVLGREQMEHQKGIIHFYLFDNGKVEKRITHIR